MTIKKRVPVVADSKAIEMLANELADRPYGRKQDNRQARTTISLPLSMLVNLEDMAREHKRTGKSLKSVSAIIRHYIEKSLKV